jgi:hypothetical protein
MRGNSGGGPMSVTAGPEADGAAQITALFAEARRRRRRRITGAVVGLALAGSALIGLRIGGRHQEPGDAGARARAAAIAQRAAQRFTLPAAYVAWVDYSGRLHVGDVATRIQRVVAAIPAAADSGLTPEGSSLVLDWSGPGQNVGPVRALDLEHGKITGPVRQLPRGEAVFASASGPQLYIVQTARRLIEVPADGRGARRVLRVPAGWYAYAHSALAVAGGIVVNANSDGRSRPAEIALWSPRTGRVRIIGRGIADDAYTPPGGSYSLLAWTPARCLVSNCPAQITNTLTRATVSVRSPLGHGFTAGDATFSPDGSELAMFARRTGIDSRHPNQSELAIASTRTGAVRLVRAARLETQEDAGWAAWLPGGQRLLAGALLDSYAVDAQTLAARPFFFFPGAPDHNIMDTPDVNFSTVVLPGPAGRPGR